jgi:glycine betaine/proline transport system substrate-binding protein
MKKAVKQLAVGLALLAGFGGSAYAQDLKLGASAQPYANIIGNIIKITLEENLGAKVTILPTSSPVLWKALDTGEINIHPSMWLPNSQSYYDEYVVKKASVSCFNSGWRIQQGFMTTKFARDKYGIRKIEDLLKPEVVALTDTNRDGKGEIWAGDPTWNTSWIDKLRAKGYGFADLYEMQTYSEEVAAANILAALKADKVAIFTGDEMIASHFPGGSVVLLEEPPHDPTKWNPRFPAQDPNWYQNGNVATSYKVVTTSVCYNKALKTAAPHIASLLEAIKFDTDEVRDLNYENTVKKRTPEAIAKEWAGKNKDRIKTWLANK